jgi:hypothetical protein
MIEMSYSDYLEWNIRREIAKQAASEGIKITDVKPKPRPKLITRGGVVVVMKPRAEEDE